MSSGPGGSTTASPTVPMKGLDPYGTQVDYHTEEAERQKNGHTNPLNGIPDRIRTDVYPV